MISENEYNTLKEYYDHQRLREYNKERVYDQVQEFLDRVEKMTKEEGELNPLEHSLEEMVEKIWENTEEKDWHFPIPKSWVPRDPRWRLWREYS
jgi:hypothetical protein